MTPSVHDKPYREIVGGAGDETCRFRTWSDDEWRAMPAGHQPPGAIRIGEDWAEFQCFDRTDAGVSVDSHGMPAGRGPLMIGTSTRPIDRRGRCVPADSILVDAGMPGIQEYLRQATLDGLIRTVPAGGKRVYIIPLPRRIELESPAGP